MVQPKLHVKQGDKVKVISGKDRGKEGEVLKVLPEENRVLVKGINIIKKHVQPTQDNPQGGIVEKEGPIHGSNVQLVCQYCGEAARTGKKVFDNGEKARYCKKCDEVID
ncbi:50S ribosomal protein L24 [Natroniella sulfidigena]|uniref:50S ribosomal protein L24 n=1 Tax=Natroniella sulfidigena TaxID=723921 RepID=UPI00200A5548|nr:50S ribosomal protein L24 [Natroniella sulfidigena]MCK8816197.1 50S ribosomal protein L24 [Natroniella sulfidigena]